MRDEHLNLARQPLLDRIVLIAAVSPEQRKIKARAFEQTLAHEQFEREAPRASLRETRLRELHGAHALHAHLPLSKF